MKNKNDIFNVSRLIKEKVNTMNDKDGEMEQKHVSVNWLEPAQKTYNKKVMEALRQRRGLEPGDVSQDGDIMSMSKQDVFNEYCQWEGLLGGFGYSLLNVVENIYDINLQQ